MKSEKPFFLFGMGNRDKYIYMDGKLISYPDYTTKYTFDNSIEQIIPQEYTVILKNAKIYENEAGVYIEQNDCTTTLCESKLNLPDFNGHKYRDALRILHHEILINIIDGLPVPNYFVYKKPWYRDGAMMCMVLDCTGNLALVEDWANSLKEIYDRNNKGCEESDNIGQAMYIIAKAGRKDHPLIPKLLDEAHKCAPDGVLGGMTDYNHHPVYQTKWLKLGLDTLGLDSSWVRIPAEPDTYSSLFWMNYKDQGGEQNDYDEAYNEPYPYLWWAKQNFYEKPVDDALLKICYPMSWEAEASEAEYQLIAPLSEAYAQNRHAAPHTWHAAEMFLYLFDEN